MVTVDKLNESTTAVDERIAKASQQAASIFRTNPTLDEQEEFDAEWRAQAPDAKAWVVWDGLAGVDYREISVKDWRNAGVGEDQNPGYVRWDAGNDWRIPRSMLDFLTEGQFQQFILRDGRFKVVEER